MLRASLVEDTESCKEVTGASGKLDEHIPSCPENPYPDPPNLQPVTLSKPAGQTVKPKERSRRSAALMPAASNDN